ncbi:MAG: PQQ-binding-like beta-propeller repeat protein [Tannerella sp.]|jgi:outer membrane protein assembly factor BamB|nr:PQQ-binding-like beta-propeller repeat protein [Tannerella sp.]
MRHSFLFLIGTLLTMSSLFAQSPYGFRGPFRNGFYPDTGLLKEWPADGLQLLWEITDIGKGYSSPVIANDRLFVTGLNEDEDQEIFYAYTLDGKKIYETVFGRSWRKSYPETRVTPTIEGNRAYVISGTGELVCINITNGNMEWKVDGPSLGIVYASWGMAECPLVFDNKVIFTPCGNLTTMMALNAATGKVEWQTESLGDPNNYASPILITHNNKKQIIGVTGRHIIGVNPENGKIEWKYDEWGREYLKKTVPGAPLRSEESTAPNSPVYSNGRIYHSCGYDFGSVMLELNNDATAVSTVWRNNDLDTHHGGLVLVNGTIYGTNWISNAQGNWVAVDWNSGVTKYNIQWGGNSKGSIITADQMLYCYDERRGIMALVKPNPEKFDVVSEFRITKGEGPHWAHPVIDKGILYIRHGSVVMAYRLKP